MTSKPKKLAIFDFDSTLCEIETLDEFAKNLDLYEKVKKITQKGMDGELDFFTSIISRVELLKGTDKQTLENIYKIFPLTKGAKEIIEYLKEQNYTVIIFSGGFDIVLEHFTQLLQADTYFTNTLHFDKNDKLTGKVGGEMMFDNSKGKMLLKLQKTLKITPENTLVVGDGANDISMFNYASLRVAFCAKPILKQHANIIIDERNLLKIKEYL